MGEEAISSNGQTFQAIISDGENSENTQEALTNHFLPLLKDLEIQKPLFENDNTSVHTIN